MNNQGIYMNNPDNYRSLDFALECVSMTKLGGQWNRQLLTGNFYRLYRNDAPGAGVVYNRRKHEITPDAIYILPPNCNLRTYCDNPEARQLYIHFELPRYDCAEPLNCIALDEELRRLSDRLIAGITSGEPREFNAITAFALCGAALTRLPAAALTMRPLNYPVARVCAYLRNNLALPHEMSELARIARIPAGEFSRRFREATGCTPYRYLTNMRYERAEQLLSSGNISIDEICSEIGIRDRFHFSRCFKRRYGHPPAAYRKLLLGNRLEPQSSNLPD